MDEKEFLLKLKENLEEVINLINDRLSIPEEEKTVKKVKRFSKPTLEDVANYCKERKNNIDPEKFYDYYESINWFRGRSKIKDWKAVVRTWENRSGNKGTYSPQTFGNKQISNNELIKFRGKFCECKGQYVKFENKIYDFNTGYEITEIEWKDL